MDAAAHPRRRWLLRYDTESTDAAAMDGFLAKVAAVHAAHDLPVTLFCTGGALDARAARFRAFQDAVGDDPRFEIGDHSYSHVGAAYTAGPPVAELRADYERSLGAHERVLGTRPDSVSLCGTGGRDGERLPGFDVTEKARAELEMFASLGVRRINALLSGSDESRAFADFARLGHPEISGFPSGFSDTSWLVRAEDPSDPLVPLRAEIDRRADEDAPMPVILHDWAEWTRAPDQELTLAVRLADYARSRGFIPMTVGAAVAAYRAE